MIHSISGPTDGQREVKKYAYTFHQRGLKKIWNNFYDIIFIIGIVPSTWHHMYKRVISKFGSNLTKPGNTYFSQKQVMGVQFHFNNILIIINIIGRGKHHTTRKPLTCHKSPTNINLLNCIKDALTQTEIEVTTL